MPDREKALVDLLIEASHLYRSFGDLQAVNGVGFRVSSGEIYGLVGPDGAGKTTVMRLLCGALLPDKPAGGEPCAIQIAGLDMLRQTEEARAHIGYLPQRFSLYEELTVMENLRFFAEVRGLSTAEWQPRCMEILRFVGLDPFTHLRAGHLSGGMKQKLGLAAALVHRPRVLLLDEPTTGVDPVTRQDFWRLIIRLAGGEAQSGIAVLVSTPYMDEASRCHQVGFMRAGQLILEGTPTKIRGRLEGQILELRGHPLRLLQQIAASDEDVETALLFGDCLHLRVRPTKSQAVMDRLRAVIPAGGGEVALLRQIPPQLEDMFIALQEH